MPNFFPMKHLLLGGLLSLLLATSGWSEDPFQGRIHSIERASRLLLAAPPPANPSWGQMAALEDLSGLLEASSKLRLKLDEGEEDLGDFPDELRAYQIAANRVRMSLSLGQFDSEGQQVAQGLAEQVKEVDDFVVGERRREEERRALSRARDVYYRSQFGYPWGWGWGPTFGIGIGWGRGWGWRCR